MLQVQSELILRAQTLQAETDTFHIAQRGLQDAETDFPIGSYVLETFQEGGPTKGSTLGKLYPPLAGPFRVVNRIGTKYTISNLLTGKPHDVHVTRLREFLYDPAVTNPREAAMRDDHQYTVEEIIKHRGVATDKTKMEFLVRWTGFGSETDTWEPWKELRLVEALHIYLREHGMKQLIPK